MRVVGAPESARRPSEPWLLVSRHVLSRVLALSLVYLVLLALPRARLGYHVHHHGYHAHHGYHGHASSAREYHVYLASHHDCHDRVQAVLMPWSRGVLPQRERVPQLMRGELIPRA